MAFQLVCHAIGDAAIEQIIRAYEKALKAHPDPDRRHRIEHCGFSTAAQHKRMIAAGIYPCPQQVFIHDFGDAYVAALGDDKGKSSYPMRTWFDLGLKPSTGSDAPVCDPDPFPNFQAMLTRKTWRGTVMDARQCISIEEALQAYTEFGAFSQRQEHRKGKLVPGMLADIAVFSRNLLTASPQEIYKETHCDMTILGARSCSSGAESGDLPCVARSSHSFTKRRHPGRGPAGRWPQLEGIVMFRKIALAATISLLAFATHAEAQTPRSGGTIRYNRALRHEFRRHGYPSVEPHPGRVVARAIHRTLYYWDAAAN